MLAKNSYSCICLEIVPLRGKSNHGVISGTLEATAMQAKQEEEEMGEINVWKVAATVILTQMLESASDSPLLPSCVGPIFTNTSLSIASA